MYLSDDGQQFLLALCDLQEAEIDWYAAMAKYGNRLPSMTQDQVMANNYNSINVALSVFGGEIIGFDDFYWTRDEYDSVYAYDVYMSGAIVAYSNKTTISRVRAVAAVPVASAM